MGTTPREIHDKSGT